MDKCSGKSAKRVPQKKENKNLKPFEQYMKVWDALLIIIYNEYG